MDANNTPAFVLVDDDADDRFFMREAVERSGSTYRVEEFATGAEFLAYLQQELDEKGGEKVLWLVILDLNLPDMDGKAILKAMQQRPIWSQVPVIVLSGQEGSSQAADLKALGANDYLVKPSSMDELVHHIQTTFAPWLEQPVRLSLENEQATS
ncbi:response regulator [Fibrella sp. HMF5335]|uniref:Response regulator n=1 Tax=Fibrella rubiginis TaxID=2817060 RepID=A0A939K5M3_9BACT|nr:response regulator [Fibrella rubiginis]MBO0939639.1 response regulator [Fibrella rubiginis]